MEKAQRKDRIILLYVSKVFINSEAFPTHVYQGTDWVTLKNRKLFGCGRKPRYDNE